MIAQPPIAESLWKTVPPHARAAILARVSALEQRVAELDAENAELRRRLAQLEHELQKVRQRGKRSRNSCDSS